MERKDIFKAKLTGHSLDPDSADYKSWNDLKKAAEFCFAACSFEEAIQICRSWGKENIIVGDRGSHKSESIEASFVTIDQLTREGHIYV